MKQSINDIKNSFFKDVIIHLNCGTIISGIISPEFWVRNGPMKKVYPNPQLNAIGLIPSEKNDEYLRRLLSGEMLFDEMPEGYVECPIEQIKLVKFHQEQSDSRS